MTRPAPDRRPPGSLAEAGRAATSLPSGTGPRVKVSRTATALDVSLARVGEHFTARLDELRPDDPLRSVVVDIAALGLGDLLRAPDPGWYDTAVYPIRLVDRTVLLGPARTRQGPCPRCLDRRWQAIRPAEERRALEGRDGRGGAEAMAAGPVPELTPFTLDAMWQVFARTAGAPPAPGDVRELHELRLDTLQTTRYELIADSRCPVCAHPRPDTADGARFAPSSRLKPAVDTYRLRDTRDYSMPFAAYVNPVCGALGPAAMRAYHCNVTSPVSGFFQIRSQYDLHESWWSGHADSYGESETCGVIEGLERYAGNVARTKAVSVYDSFAGLSPDALDPRECGVYDAGYYRDRSFQYAPFSPDRPLYWVWGHSLRSKQPILVPEQLVYYLDWRIDQPNFVQECSNGCASGSCLEEAVFYALLELVERDAFLVTWYAGLAVPEIDLSTCTSPASQFMRDRVALLGYDMRAFDIRMDLPVPAVLAVGVRREPGLGNLCFAAGAGFDPEDAVRAALCEVASYVPDFDERVAKRLPELEAMAADYREVTELMHHSLLHGLPEMADRSAFLLDGDRRETMADTYAGWLEERPATPDLRDDVEYLVNRLLATGSDVIVVDQTCPEQRAAGVATACVIVPGLLPIDFGWERQRAFNHPRLYTAPRLAGYRDADLTPDQLSRHPHPFP